MLSTISSRRRPRADLASPHPHMASEDSIRASSCCVSRGQGGVGRGLLVLLCLVSGAMAFVPTGVPRPNSLTASTAQVTLRQGLLAKERRVMGWEWALAARGVATPTPSAAESEGVEGEGEGGRSGLEGPLDGDGDDPEGLEGEALKASLLDSVNKAAAAALATSASASGGKAVAAAPPKRKGRSRRTPEQEEADFVVKTEDDVCRATVAVISSGDEADLAMLTPFVERLLTRYGDRIEILHRAFVPEDKPGIRLLEIWFEGFETFPLYSRYKFLKKGKRGELDDATIDDMCTKIDYAMYLDATDDFGPF